MLNFIVNPNALKGKQDKFLKKLEARLKEEGAEYRLFFSEKKGGIGKYARSLTEAGQKKIIAVGGDGTLNEVLANLHDPSQVELGLIPAGTGNDFAVAAKIPNGIAALDLILKGEAIETDYIECGNGVRSMNIAGLGMDVDILQRCAAKKRGGNKSKYFHSLLSSLAHYRGLKMQVTANGETKEYDAFIAFVSNGTQFGGGIPICPDAKIDDGFFNLVVIECPKRSKILFELIRLMRGKILTRPISHQLLCKEAKIVPVGEQLFESDGELFPVQGALEAKIVSGKLKMYRG